jgi:hypothetical protein
MEDKDQTIKDIYNNFYGSMVDTYKDARKKIRPSPTRM